MRSLLQKYYAFRLKKMYYRIQILIVKLTQRFSGNDKKFINKNRVFKKLTKNYLIVFFLNYILESKKYVNEGDFFIFHK